MLVEFVRWWYGPGWLDAWRRAGNLVISMERAFSTGVLLRTLFSPWKQIVTLPGRSIGEKFRAAVDNLISRTIGFFVRLLALLAASILMVVAGAIGIVTALVWPLFPIALPYLLYRSIRG